MAMEEVDEKDLYPPTNPNQPAWRKGDLDGMDAPIDEGWRSESEDLIRLAGVQSAVEIVSLTWSFAKVQVVVPGKTSSEDQSRLVKEIHSVWEDPRTPEICCDVLEKVRETKRVALWRFFLVECNLRLINRLLQYGSLPFLTPLPSLPPPSPSTR
jgi:hypothetical protein